MNAQELAAVCEDILREGGARQIMGPQVVDYKRAGHWFAEQLAERGLRFDAPGPADFAERVVEHFHTGRSVQAGPEEAPSAAAIKAAWREYFATASWREPKALVEACVRAAYAIDRPRSPPAAADR